jgi:glycosyltransferase involved in cell wall biosynthesis
MFPHRTYPSDHAMMETIYSRILPSRGHRIDWIMRRGEGAPDLATVEWNASMVHLLPGRPNRTGPVEFPLRVIESIRAAEQILRTRSIDVIQVRNELADACAAIVVCKRWHKRFVYQLSFPIGESGRSATSVRSVLAQRLRLLIMRQADLVLAISDRMRSELIAQGLPEGRVASFPLGVDTDVDPALFDRRVARRELGLPEGPTILYLGTLERTRRLELLLDVIEGVRRRVPAATLVMLGTAPDPADARWLQSEAARRGLAAAVRFPGGVPRARVPAYLAAADVSVSPFPPLPFFIVASPTKVVESLGMGVPVVANEENPDQAQVLSRSGGGIVVPYRATAFAEALSHLLSNPEEARAAGERGRAYVVEHRSYRTLAERVEVMYASLLRPRR